jgi:hypothetical protein
MPSNPAVTLHVGQMKTATTSLQAALYSARDELAAVGVQYFPAAGRYHNREAFDLLRRDPTSVASRSDVFRHTIEVALADGREYWSDFVRSVRERGGRSILSAEGLSVAGPGSVSLVASDLAGVPVRVVLTTRPLSTFVLSLYGELAKKLVVPDPDTMVRRVLRDLVDRGADSTFAWMHAGRIREVWQPIASDGWYEVAFGDGSIDEYQARFWQALGIDGASPPALPRENASLPIGALLAWQDDLRARSTRDRRVEGRTVTTLAAHDAATGAAPRSAVRFRADVAACVDRCFPVDAPALPVGSAEMDDLRHRIASAEPLLEFVPVAGVHGLDEEIAYWREVIARKRRAAAVRMTVARGLRLRRRDQPDWDRFREGAPEEEWGFEA